MTFAAIAAAQLPIPSRMRPDLPPSFDAWFKRALERDVNVRFQTAKELADELARALDAGPISLVNVGGVPSQLDLEAIAGLREQPVSQRGSGIKPALADLEDDEPLDLLTLSQRNSALSATDLPPTAAPEGTPPPSSQSRRRSVVGRVLVSLVLLAGAGAAGWFGYVSGYIRVLRPRAAVSRPSPTATSVAAAATAVPSDSSQALPVQQEQQKWIAPLEEGQQLLTSGDADGALRKFKEAMDAGGGAVAKSFSTRSSWARRRPVRARWRRSRTRASATAATSGDPRSR